MLELPPVEVWLPIFNVVSLGLFVAAVVIGLARMIRRLIELRLAGRRIPRLLRRDILLFTAFALAFGIGGFLARVLGIPLTREPLWIVPVTTFALGAIFYWVRVEYSLEDEDSFTEEMGSPANGDLPHAGDAEG